MFDKIRGLKPSARGEYEISDVNQMYVSEGRAAFAMVNGFWSDAGTPESKRRAEDYIYSIGTEKFLK